MSKLAILGGKKVREKPFPRFNLIGEEERLAVDRVMRTGVLSLYQGSFGDDFMGGPEVRAFEEEWSQYFGVKHTVAVNSNSSGLQAALGACGVGPGDEVIVSPYSMSVSASAPLLWNAIPVFADIDPNTYNISPQSIRSRITPRTKAILVVDIFGCPADLDEIRALAKEHKLRVIEDAAQAPGALYKGKMVGGLSDITVFSLNYHKHIHTGEGGMCTTNDDELAQRMQLIRNHAESVVEPMGVSDLTNMIGFNFRLLEIQAAMGREQLKKLKGEIRRRQEIAPRYDAVVNSYPFLKAPKLTDRTHSYYGHPFQFDESNAGISRKRFVDALKAELAPFASLEHEGVPIGQGYVRPIYLIPMFQKKIAYKGGYPFTGKEDYSKGICPIVEEMHYKKLWLHGFTKSSMSDSDVNDVITAYRKVCDQVHELRE